MNSKLLEIATVASALAAADRSGLLLALGARDDTPEGFARRLDLDSRATGYLLEVLRAHGFVTAKDGRYTVSQHLRDDVRVALAEPGSGVRLFAHAERFLRDGTAFFAEAREAEGRGVTYNGAVAYLGSLFTRAANELAAALDCLGPAEEILDVGAGSAVWGLGQLARSPGARLTALDLPPVLPHARARAEDLGLVDRLDLLAGDYHTLELPEARFDRILLANVVHLEPAGRARELVKRISRALRPDGHVVIVDFMAGPTPELDRAYSGYAWFLALRIPDARAHPEPDLRRWLTEAGLTPTRRIDLAGPPPGLSALRACRP